ncbi:DUF4307 domain-containing protein [Leucobacter soli]|uniref:DUF4307 domain-containing protein n=1 Tax=Leucobacter soli TaxID=2812850 RepID=A0A916JZ62_9MICO|nr:DUF4307 domain-containing protein [Leucobacter soli]CAG7613933.1 hypothetical protein LEUCIP111803_01740 [Leucobacter soli]
MTTPPADRLDERYGRTRQRGIDRRVGWTLASAAVLLGTVVLFFSNWETAAGIEAKVVHYEVRDSRTVALDFDVTAPAGAPVACAIEALSESFATVGWRVLELPPSEQRTRSFTETITTTYPGTTARVHSCWIVESD